jgi:hypothetical protein
MRPVARTSASSTLAVVTFGSFRTSAFKTRQEAFAAVAQLAFVGVVVAAAEVAMTDASNPIRIERFNNLTRGNLVARPMAA